MQSTFVSFPPEVHAGDRPENLFDHTSRAVERSRTLRRKTKGNRVLMFGRIRELALYRAAVLRDRGFEVSTPETREEAIAAIRRGHFDVVVLTYTLSNEIVLELGELVREYCPDCPIVVIANTRRLDREIKPDVIVRADDGPAALIDALHRTRQLD
jgi:hypothetical protein